MTAGGNVIVDADGSEDLFSLSANIGIAVGSGGSNGETPAGAGGVIVHVIDTDTRAFVGLDPQAPPALGNVEIVAQGSVAIGADSTTKDDASAGSAAVSLKNNGYGAAVAVVVDLDDTLAFVGDGATVTALGMKAIDVRDGNQDGNGNQGTEAVRGFALGATSYEDHFLLAIGAGGTIEADKAGLGLSVTVDVNKGQTQATVGDSASINAVNTGADAQQDLLLRAVDSTDIMSVAGGAAIAGGTAIGGAITVAIVENDVKAVAEGNNTIKVADGVALQAETHGDIDSLAISVAGVLNIGSQSNSGGGKSTNFAGAGSGSGNTVTNTTVAEIAAGSAVDAGGAVTLAASDDTSIRADAGGVAGAISTNGQGTLLAIGASIATNAADTTVLARITGSTVDAGSVSLAAENAQKIRALTLAGAFSVATQGSTAFGGAGSGSGNDIDATINAVIDGSTINTTGNVVLTAIDASNITSDAGSAALAITTGGSSSLTAIAAGAAVATNDIANQARAAIEDSDVDVGGTLDVQASSTASIDTFTLGIAGTVAAGSHGTLPLAGAGSGSGNYIANTIEGVVEGSRVTTLGAMSIAALDDSTIKAEAGSAVVTIGVGSGTNVGVGLGLSMTINQIGNTTHAVIDDSEVVTGDMLTMSADGTSDIDSLALGVALGVTAFSGKNVSINAIGAASSNEIANVIEAVIRDSDSGDAESVQAGGTISLSATDDASINAEAIAATATVAAGSRTSGGGSLVAAVVINTIDNQTRAAIDGVDVVTTLGNLELAASSASDIDAIGVAASVGFSGSGASAIQINAGASIAKNEVSNTVETVIADAAVAAPGAVSLSATDDTRITADLVAACVSAAFGSRGSGGLAVAGTVVLNDISNTTRALIENGAAVDATGTFTASVESNTQISAVGVAASASVSMGSGNLSLSGAGTGAVVDNDISNQIVAGVTGGSSVDADGVVTITAEDNANISSEVIAAAASIGVGSGSVTVSLAVAVSVANNSISNSTRALIDDSSVSAGGSLTLTADAMANIDVTGIAAALSVAASSGTLAVGASVTVAVVTNTVDGVVEALISEADALDGQSVTAAGPITISATNMNDIDAVTGSVATTISATGGSVSISAAVAAAVAENAVGTQVTAGIRDSVVSTSSGGVNIDVLSNTSVDATTFAASIGVSGSSSVAGSFSGAARGRPTRLPARRWRPSTRAATWTPQAASRLTHPTRPRSPRTWCRLVFRWASPALWRSASPFR